MFTGIVESLGRVLELEDGSLVVEPLSNLGEDPIIIGESVAVNGCCLTVVAAADHLRFDLSPETMERTAFGQYRIGTKVNLERAMRADGRFGGHLVQGHVDGTGEVVSITPSEGASVFRFRVPAAASKYLVDKGSIAIDGISLTVVTPSANEFDVWIIPHTLANTNLSERRPGDAINLEYDMMARYAERLLMSVS